MRVAKGTQLQLEGPRAPAVMPERVTQADEDKGV